MILGIKINLPAMMLQNIKDVANRSRTYLPYAMVFILIFKDTRVDLECEDYKEIVHIDYLNVGTLYMMKFEKRGDRQMRRKSGQEDM